MKQTATRKEKWAGVRFETATEQEDLACWLMIDHGAHGCEVENINDTAIAIKATFAISELSPGVIDSVMATLNEYGLSKSLPTFKVYQIAQEDWLSKWKEGFEPTCIGAHFLICPPWRKDTGNSQNNKRIIIIDPGMAFGTGHHATTQYCLKAIEKFARGTNIIDIGTGSSILAIAGALTLPEAHIVAIDNNHHAIENAAHNIRLNNLEKRITLIEREPDSSLKETFGKFNTILSNMTCEDIIAFLPLYSILLAGSGTIICAGILNDRVLMLKHAATQYPLSVIDEEVTGEWVGITFQHNAVTI